MTTQATEPAPEPPVARRLTRSSTDRVITGVAGGLGRYFSIDPVVVRLIFIVALFFGGAGVIAYLVASLIVPSDTDAGEGFDAAGIARRLGIAVGVLVLTGAAALGGFWGFALGGRTATAVVVIGVGALLILGGVTRGMRWLIVPALALALSAGAAAAANIDARGGAGERIYRPATADVIQPNYRLGVGHLLLDLRNTRFQPGNATVHLKLGVGQIEVLVPDDVCVSSTAHVAAGATTVFDRQSGGADHDWRDIHRPPAGTRQLTLNADVGVGEFRIEHNRWGTAPAGKACHD